jgi:dolichol kinase
MLSWLEIKRKCFHLFAGIAIILLIYFDILNALIAGIVLLVAIILSLISKKYKIPVIRPLLDQFDRRKDIKNFPGKGAVFFVLGVFLVLLLFEKDVALASIAILAVGDSIAPLVGQYGIMEHPLSKKKMLEGTIAGGILAFLAAMIFISWQQAAWASLFAMIAEGIRVEVSGNPIDDNISMPLVAGAVIWIIRRM